MRPSPQAAELLFSFEPERVVNSLHFAHPDQRGHAMPRLVEWLEHADDSVRGRSFQYLTTWSGEEFGRDWRGFRLGRPTVDEGRAAQAAWREWWGEHGAEFTRRK